MDEQTKLMIFVNEFCNRLASTTTGMRDMQSFYVFEDTRPGTVKERFTKDAESHYNYTKMFQV